MKPFSQHDVTVVKKEVVFQGYFRMLKYYFTHALFSGGTSDIVVRELFERDTAVAVIPYDPVRDQIVMVEQIRVGAFGHDINPWMIELVAGMIEEGELADDVAKRELKEETGLDCHRLDKIMSYLVSPGGTSECIDLYIAEVDASQALTIAGLACESEDIRTMVMDVNEAIEQLSQSKFQNGVTIVGLQWLALNHRALKSKWRP
ncbi:MAG: NUDIX domain-containing protein [Psychrobium sp.]